MSVRRTLAVLTSAGLAAFAGLVSATSAAAHEDDHSSPGTRSLATALAADRPGFDRNWSDYDIVEAAVAAVLKTRPQSPVKVLTDGTKPLTAFIPSDQAFRALASDLTGKHYGSEKAVFSAVASLGIDTVETVLRYHVVPGATVDYRTAKRSDGAKLTTALGSTITVDLRREAVFLLDADTSDRNARVVQPNLNKGNRQIAHGISQVLRPVDLS